MPGGSSRRCRSGVFACLFLAPMRPRPASSSPRPTRTPRSYGSALGAEQQAVHDEVRHADDLREFVGVTAQRFGGGLGFGNPVYGEAGVGKSADDLAQRPAPELLGDLHVA